MFVELDDYSMRDALIHPFIAGVANYVVIPTNEQAIHGAGLALIIRNAFPQLEPLSREVVYEGDYETAHYLHISNTSNPLIKLVLVPTKHSPKDRYSSVTMIAQQMFLLRTIVGDDGVIVMPKIGCGLGGLKWHEEVGPLVKHIIEDNASYANIVIPTKRMEIATLQEGLNHGLAVLDYAVYSADPSLGMSKVVWFGFTEYGMVSYAQVLEGTDIGSYEDGRATLINRDVLILGSGTRRATQEFVDMYNSKRYSHTPQMMWSMLYEAAKPLDVNNPDRPF